MAEKFKYTDYQLESWDYVVLVVYFVSILFVGIWVKNFVKLILQNFLLKKLIKNFNFKFFSKKSQQEGKNGAGKKKTKIKNLKTRDFKIKWEIIFWLQEICILFL